jgi:hypothetical protein
MNVFVRRACVLLLVTACGHEERRETVVPGSIEGRLTPVAPPPQYVVADPHARGGVVMIPLSANAQGIVVDRRRVIVGAGEPKLATEAPKDPILGASRLPARFGGGFVFWTANDVYRAASFDGQLVPIVRVPEAIEAVSLGPKSLLVRTKNGERWSVGAKGDRLPVLPLGVADVQALEDGRVLGFTDLGSVFTSTDSAVHTVDVTSQVKSAPTSVLLQNDELWLLESGGGASRLESDGHLTWFDKSPVAGTYEVRKRDPRWRGSEPPLRAAFKSGAAVEGGRLNEAIVIDSGDLVRIDTRSGELLSVVPGRLPPDAQCDAVPTGSDVVFACTSRTGQGSSFVVSHTLGSEPPMMEQTFPAGSGFYASDDGGLVYAGSCNGSTATNGVCVRMPNGHWEDRDASGLTLDGGAPDVTIARWVPRADGRVIAIVTEPTPGLYDPATLAFTPAGSELRDVMDPGTSAGHFVTKSSHRVKRHLISGAGIVDDTWSFVPGTTSVLRGWRKRAESVEITEDGRVVRSAFTFDVVTAGPYGLGRSQDGRLYQSSDHGATWSEVAGPPSGVETSDLVSCTTAGCDLGVFYRIGWSKGPPRIDPPRAPAPSAPSIKRTRGTELACRPSGSIATKAVPRSESSPEDLGLGASRLAIANEKTQWSYVRDAIARTIPSPVHELSFDGGDTTPSLRGILSGFGTNHEGDALAVSGPSKNILGLRRGLAYVPAFDPGGRIVRSAIDFRDILAAGRRAGMASDEIFSDDPTESGTLVPLLSIDPAGISDIAFHNADRGLYAFARGERTRAFFHPSTNTATLVSGVLLPGDEAAFLEAESAGVEHVFKIGAAGATTDLFDVNTSSAEAFYPANPDALALGPKGDLALVRTSSGSDPPSALDPALLLVQGMPPVALAPWSEMKWADDPACKAEPGGHRAVLQLIAPWIRLTSPDLRAIDAPSLVRVRWTTKRVCVEAFEVEVAPVTMRVPSSVGNEPPTSFASWIVGRGSAFARVVVADGFEWRQPLECGIVSTGP